MGDQKLTYLIKIVFSGVLILLNSPVSHAATPPCGSTLTSNTTLDSNMICPLAESSNGLNLIGSGSDNIVVDCAGYSIKTSGRASTAIRISDVTGVTIKNCNLETDGSLAYGISVVDSSMSELANNTITTLNTFSLGIQIQRSSNVLVENNTVSTTGISSRGINLRDNSTNNVVTGNNVISALSQGVRIRAYSDNNTISQNSIESGTSQALRIESSSNNTLSGNTFVSPLSFVVIRNLPIQNGGLSVDDAGNIFAVENNFGSAGGSGGEVATMVEVDSNTGETISTVRLLSGGDDLGFGFDSLEIMSDGRFLATRGGNNTSLYQINPVSGEITLQPIVYPALNGSLNGLQATGANTLLATTNDGELLNIDLGTNTASLIGQDGEGWTDLALHPTTGKLYTLSRWSYEPSGTSHLYQIDPASGDIIQEIGDTGEAFVSDIDFSTSGILYANSGLYTINESTGAAVYIGGFGPDPYEALSQNNTLVDQVFTATTAASVQFTDPLDLPPSLLLNLDSNAIQLGQNSIFVDSALYPFLDVPARITFENLGGAIRNLLVDFEDDGTFELCEPPQCTLVSFTGGTLVFDVTGFTTYTSEDSESPPADPLITVVAAVLVEIDALMIEPGVSKAARKQLKLAVKRLIKAQAKLGADSVSKGLLELGKGVAELLKAKKKKADVVSQINLLVEASKAEAQAAIDLAESAPSTNPKLIDAAKVSMTKAQNQQDAGKPDKAIKLYRSAWNSADKAILPDILGTYVGNYSNKVKSCKRKKDNGKYQFSIVMDITSVDGAEFTGSAVGTINLGGDSFEELILISGTLDSSGRVSGKTSHTFVGTSGKGSFTGKLTGDSLTLLNKGKDKSGDTCKYTRSIAATRE